MRSKKLARALTTFAVLALALNGALAAVADSAPSAEAIAEKSSGELSLLSPGATGNGERARPIMLVQGYDPTGTIGYDMRDRWDTFRSALRGYGWTGPIVAWSHYVCDYNMHADDRDAHNYGSHGSYYASGHENDCGRTNGHNRDADIRHLAYHWAQAVWAVYGTQCVKAVGYSMGGLIIRYALTRIDAGDSAFPSQLCVSDVVTMGTPHDGLGGIGTGICQYFTVQCDQMRTGSSFLGSLGSNPQASVGTQWTVMGADETDDVVDVYSATAMSADRRVRYLASSNIAHTGAGDWLRQDSTSHTADVTWYTSTANEWLTTYEDYWPVRASYFAFQYGYWGCGTPSYPFPLTSVGWPVSGEPDGGYSSSCYYRIDVPSGQTRLYVDLQSPNGDDRDIYVHRGSATGTQVCSDLQGGGVGWCVIDNPVAASYWVRIYNYAQTNSEFIAKVFYSNQNDCGTGADAGDRHQIASTITPVSGCSARIQQPADLDDWYKFSVQQNAGIALSMTPNSYADFDLCLYKPSDLTTAVDCSWNSGSATDSVAYTATESGTHYAKVWRWSGTGTYSMSLSVNTPPRAATLLSPANGATGVSTSPTLSWDNNGDADGHSVTHRVYLGTSNPPPTSTWYCGDTTAESCSISSLSGGTTYYWRVRTTDSQGASTDSVVWSFTTQSTSNSAPYPAHSPSPSDGATGVSTTTGVSWVSGGDADGDALTYTVYFGTNYPPTTAYCSGTSSTWCSAFGTLAYSTTYYWQVRTEDGRGGASTGPIWSFRTTSEPNASPYAATLNSPSNGATGVSTSPTVSWTNNGDPDGDSVTHTVYLGTSSSPGTAYCSGTTATSCSGFSLSAGTTYYWKVRTTDSRGASADSSVWSFTTQSADSTPTLRNHEAQRVTLSLLEREHYRIYVPAGAVSLDVTLDGSTCAFPCLLDANLFVKQGARASTTSYDCASRRLSSNAESCTFTNPATGWWYVMVDAYTGTGTVQLRATYRMLEFSDDMESGSGQWIVSDDAADGTWAITTFSAHSPSRSFGMGGSGGYRGGSDDSLQMATSLDLRNLHTATLSFWNYADGECLRALNICTLYLDYGVVQVSTNGGASWTTLRTGFWNQGSQTSMVEATIPLDAYVGSVIDLRWRWRSDALNGGDHGWFVDDVRVVGAPIE